MRNFRFSILFLITIIVSFFLGIWIQKQRSPVEDRASANNASQLPKSFGDIVKNSTSKEVTPFDSNNTLHQQFLQRVSEAAESALAHFNKPDSSLKGMRRINEASRYFEDYLRITLDASAEFTCQFAKTTSGVSQRSGYPDLHLIHNPSGTHVYIDPKLYEQTSETSTLRTFYYSPTSPNQKIQHNALHLTIGFSHDGQDGNWTFTGWKICDLSSLQLKLKSEYNASNRDLYHDGLILSGGTS